MADLNSTEHSIMNTVLQNHVVLQQIFPHLDLSDLKSCRLMCKKWKEVSRPEFIKKSVFSIRNTESVARDLELLKQDFSDGDELLPFQFKNFLFEGEFKEEDLDDFFEDRPFIKELTLVDFSVSGYEYDQDKSQGEFDISTWSGLSLTSLTITNRCFVGTSLLFVPLNYIPDIKILKLQFVSLGLNGLIAPEYVTMELINFEVCENGEDWDILSTFEMNDFFEVGNLKILEINIMEDDVEWCLDLTDCCLLESLTLGTSIYVVGMHRDLVLKRLDIVNEYVHVNLSELPPSLERLKIACDLPDCILLQGSNDVLPHVKSLGIYENYSFSTRCPNLSRLEIFACKGNEQWRTLPRSLKVLKINNSFRFWGSVNPDFKLDKLIYEDDLSIQWEEISRNINEFKPQLVVFLRCIPTPYYNAIVCVDCGCVVDGIHPVLQLQIQKGGIMILGKVYTPRRILCECDGPLPTSLFFEKGDYIKCTPDSEGKLTASSIDEEEFEAYVNDY